MSGMSNNKSIYPPDLILIAPGIISIIQDLIDKLGLSNQGLKDLFNEAWEATRKSLPFHYLDQEACYECLLKAIENDEEYVKKTITLSFNSLSKEMKAAIKRDW
ncbi:MAG: hypothetical protein ACI35O_16045, partial [Bacillaceae bacterium]